MGLHPAPSTKWWARTPEPVTPANIVGNLQPSDHFPGHLNDRHVHVYEHEKYFSFRHSVLEMLCCEVVLEQLLTNTF